MTTRRLPRSARGDALPRASGTDTVSWPPALRGRSTLLCLLLLGWLGGGLAATALAVVTDGPNDLTYGLANTVAAGVGLLVLVAVGLGRREAASPAPAEPVEVPAQATAEHDDRDLALR